MITFTRLDGSKEKIKFREPTVSDCRKFAGIPVNAEQLAVTQYLTELQSENKEVNDPLEWTAQDRLAALFYLYVSSRENTIITQSFSCDLCGEQHGRQFDLAELLGQLQTASVPMKEPIPFKSIKSGHIVPLNGHALEHLEELKNSRNSFAEGSKEWGEAHYDMRVYTTAYHLRFNCDNEKLSPREQAEARFDYLLSLSPSKQYEPLIIEIRQVIKDMAHGLPTVMQDGELKIITRPYECPNDKEGRSINLLQPFHYHEYLPNL